MRLVSTFEGHNKKLPNFNCIQSCLLCRASMKICEKFFSKKKKNSKNFKTLDMLF